MRGLKLEVQGALLAALLGGCAPVPGIGAEPVDWLESDLGGPGGVMDLLGNSSENEIRRVLAKYDIGFTVHALISDCPQYFPSSDRNVWQSFDGEFYYIESSGRPYRAYKDLPPIVSEARSTTCQASVGQWGDAENPANDYDGGHLIGSQLGGWGRRANLVPQDSNFNRGNWVVLENKMATCRVLPSGRIRYYIGANYPNGSALIPSNMTMQLTNRVTGSNVSLSFSNTDGGGANGTVEKNRGVTFLANQGCN
jgi:hypothetical protein